MSMTARLLIGGLCVVLLSACGKKPAQLQPIVAPIGQDPAYYPYPKIQTPPPAPAASTTP